MPFVEDLKQLYCDGIDVSICGNEITLFGGLLAFLADNLAVHLVGGFKQSMSFAFRVCRTCMVTPTLLQNCFSENDCNLRESETHFEQCCLLNGPLHDHHSISYGINRLSILEEVPGFSVINGLPHDIMHDLFEGVIPSQMKLLLVHCVNAKYFTIDLLNSRLTHFDFMNKKPSLFDPKVLKSDRGKIRQLASQMIVLTREFSILIGDKIPNNNDHWSCFQLLLKICSICLSPVCTFDTVAYLRIVIEEYLSLFRTIYPDVRLLPKQHFLVHYPRQIEMYGPLVNSWTMRQESKLIFVKRVSYMSNYKNISKTVAMRHQFWLCHKVLSNTHLLTPILNVSPIGVSNSLSTEEDYIQCKMIRVLICCLIVKHPSWAKVQSSSFKRGPFVLLKYDLYEPVFGKIIDLVMHEDTLLICIEEYHSSFFCSQYNSFAIFGTGVFCALDVNSLVDLFMLGTALYLMTNLCIFPYHTSISIFNIFDIT